MVNAKQQLLENLSDSPLQCKKVMDIVDGRCERQMPSPLFNVAFILNPSTYFSSDIEESNRIHNYGLLEVFKKLIPNEEEFDTAYSTLCRYKNQQSSYGEPHVMRLANNETDRLVGRV